MFVPDSHMIGSDTKTLIVDTQGWNQFVQQDMYGSLVYHISYPSFLSFLFLPVFLSPPLSLYIRFFSPSVVNISIAPTNVSLVEQLQQLTFRLFKEGTAVRDVQVVVSTQPNSAQGMFGSHCSSSC